MSGEFQFGAQGLLHLAWAVPLALLLCAWGVARRRSILARFGIDAVRFGDWLSACARRRWLRAVILALALLLLAAAAAQPRCNPEKTRFTRKARDLAVVLDVSRSMLAVDLKPNRLERAKLELARLADHLKGSRIGLIVFAGNAVIICPLTSNYTYFKSTLRNVSHTNVSQGGTKIGDAIRHAVTRLLGARLAAWYGSDADGGAAPGETQIEAEARREAEKAFADVLLITDGEDHDSYPIRAAEMTAAADVGLYIVGLGSEKGAPIPLPREGGGVEYLTYKGEIVLSRIDAKTLMEMINAAPRGAFLPAGTDHFDLVDFYKKHIEIQEGREVTEEQVSWTEIFQPFLLAGLALFLLYLLVPERPGRQWSVALQETET